MKKFCIKLIGFWAIVAVLVVIQNIWFEYRITQINHIRSDARILVLGDSHLRHGVNDVLCPEFENRGSIGEPYIVSYYKERGIIDYMKEVNPSQIKAICLSYNFFSLSYKRDSMFVGSKLGYWIDNYTPVFRNINDLPTRYGVPVDNIYTLPIRTHLLSVDQLEDSLLYNLYRGAFYNPAGKRSMEDEVTTEEDTSNNIDDEDATYGNLREFKVNKFISPIQQNILCEIIKYAKLQDLKIFLVNAPQSKRYNDKVPNSLKLFHRKFADELANEYGLVYLDYHNINLPDSCFGDESHLNIYGANYFTPALLKDIEEVLNDGL